jgi:hypothetical protein
MLGLRADAQWDHLTLAVAPSAPVMATLRGIEHSANSLIMHSWL